MSQKFKLVVRPWNPLDVDKEIWYVVGLTVDGSWDYNFIGINDKVDTVDSQTPRTSVHLYQDTKLDKMSVTDGEHSVSKGAYVAFLNVEGEAVVYIQGHVNSLHVSGDAQVFLYDGAYVDFLNCSDGGFVRIDKGASVHGLVIMKDGKAVISTVADICDKIITEGAIVSHTPDSAVHPLQVRLYFDDMDSRDTFCKQITEEYRKTNGIEIDSTLTLYGVCNCFVLPHNNGWDVYLSSSTKPQGDQADTEERIRKRFGIQNVEVWLDGISLADIKRQQEDDRVQSLHHKLQKYEKLKQQLANIEAEVFYPPVKDDDDVFSLF